jgi:eukaryotic-like serine/threonine-protein kinase
MPDSARQRVLPAVLDDRYRLAEPLGRGGASTVVRARDELLGRDVAVKLFTARATEPGDLRRQEAEARMLAAMNHHGLVTLLDAGIDLTVPEAPQVYLVLELVDGADLRTRLRAGALTSIEVGFIGFDLAGALDYVHRHGIIHRDVKPANVLLSDVGTRRVRGKLADFGIALLRDAERPEEQTTGTAAYLSPEQVEGVPLTPATDVYSLGLVLLEALTGHPAYTGTILEAALGRLERQPDIPGSVPGDMAALLRAMTARRPADRPAPADVELEFRRLVIERLDDAGVHPRVSEAERVAALRRYDLLDTPPDGGFDRITALAVRSLDLQVAVVGLADSDRLWFKSRVGVECRQIPLPIEGVQGGGLLRRTTVLMADALPAVARDAGLATVAAVPLLTAEGLNLGVLAVGDRVRRQFGDRDLATLEDLAALVTHEMELRLAVRRAVHLGGVA